MSQNNEESPTNNKLNRENSKEIPNGLVISIISIFFPLLFYYSEKGLLLVWLPGIIFRNKVWSYYQGVDFRPLLSIFGFILTGIFVFIISKLIILIEDRANLKTNDEQSIRKEYGIWYTLSGIVEIVFPFIWLYIANYSFSLEYIFLDKGLGLFQNLWPFIGIIGLFIGGTLTLKDCFDENYVKFFYEYLNTKKYTLINLAGIFLIISVFTPSAGFVYREPISQNIIISNPYAFQLIWSWGLMIGRPGMFPDISPYNEFWFPPNISFNIDFIGIMFAIVSLYLGIKLVRFKGENRNRSFSDQTRPLLILAEVTLILCLMWIVSFSFIIWDGIWGTLGRGTNTVISGPILFFRWIFYYPGFGVIGAFLSLLLITIARRSSKLDLKSSQ